MHPSATLFLDVCVQRDLWPDGVWPLVTPEEARNVAQLFALAADLASRQGGVVCAHGLPTADAPVHCREGEPGVDHPEHCATVLPMQVWGERAASDSEAVLDRAHAIYVGSGCGVSPDRSPMLERVFDHLTAGIRDAVVFGGGVEYGIDYAVGALLRRRIRTHVVLDAAGAADPVAAQVVIGRWKRRAVDGATVATIQRLLTVH